MQKTDIPTALPQRMRKRTFPTFEDITKGLCQEEILLTCPKCKSSNTRIELIQKRAIDEPATEFLQCNEKDCRFRYRLRG